MIRKIIDRTGTGSNTGERETGYLDTRGNRTELILNRWYLKPGETDDSTKKDFSSLKIQDGGPAFIDIEVQRVKHDARGVAKSYSQSFNVRKEDIPQLVQFLLQAYNNK